MANEAVQLEMDGLKRRLQKMRENLTNPSPTMQKVSTYMYKDVMDHFGKEQGDTGGWAPLKYRVGKPLQDTGDLRKSIAASNTKDTAVVSAGDAHVTYAGYHQYGTRNIPQRKFLWLSKEILDQITKVVGKFSIGDSI
jgi:phage gpG-like protein